MLSLIKENFIFKDNSNIEKCIPDNCSKEIEIKNPTTIVDYSEVNTGYLMMGALCDSAKNLKETIALDLISTILGDGKSSRLYSDLVLRKLNIRLKKQLNQLQFEFLVLKF